MPQMGGSKQFKNVACTVGTQKHHYGAEDLMGKRLFAMHVGYSMQKI